MVTCKVWSPRKWREFQEDIAENDAWLEAHREPPPSGGSQIGGKGVVMKPLSEPLTGDSLMYPYAQSGGSQTEARCTKAGCCPPECCSQIHYAPCPLAQTGAERGA